MHFRNTFHYKRFTYYSMENQNFDISVIDQQKARSIFIIFLFDCILGHRPVILKRAVVGSKRWVEAKHNIFKL